jgi:hypothetical protein
MNFLDEYKQKRMVAISWRVQQLRLNKLYPFILISVITAVVRATGFVTFIQSLLVSSRLYSEHSSCYREHDLLCSVCFVVILISKVPFCVHRHSAYVSVFASCYLCIFYRLWAYTPLRCCAMFA